jgi:SIR2-like domain
MTGDLDDLACAVRERRAILFAGAGVSMSVGLPSWRELISRMVAELEIDPQTLSASHSHHTLAEYYRLKHGSIGPLRSWMDRHWRVSNDKVRQSRVHELIVALDFPIIYTTNYDRNLEAAFEAHGRRFVKIANARDLAKPSEGATQIIKFHGDFDDDESLVIAETDYFDRLAFDTPLDIKFRADALGKTILFIGYSMSDMNIRLLLHSLWQTWRTSGHEKDRPRSFVFMAPADPVQEAVLGQWGITAVTEAHADPEEALRSFLGKLKARVDSQ